MSVETLYLDTSTIGGYYDREWMAETRLIWEQARAGRWRLVTSIIAEAELVYAPELVRKLFVETFGPGQVFNSGPEIEALAEAYLAAGVVSAKYADDALHVATATVHAVPFIVSWNFKHLVDVRREEGFNAVNRLRGMPQVRIVSPRELIHGALNPPA